MQKCAAQAKADALLAALRRRAANPQSPSSAGGASVHSSPSLQPDELSDGFNSEDEAPFNQANPLGLAEDVDDEEDDGEAALAARNGDVITLEEDAGDAALYAVDKFLAVRKASSRVHPACPLCCVCPLALLATSQPTSSM